VSASKVRKSNTLYLKPSTYKDKDTFNEGAIIEQASYPMFHQFMKDIREEGDGRRMMSED
jgi:hypothetical protein